jgi:DivIVA domain-containing protein
VPLTPAEIHNVEFQKASLGKRGYDEEQVDALLDEATREMIRLLEENDVLQRRIDVTPPPAVVPPRGAEFAVMAAELDRARHACDQAELTARQLERRLDEARRAVAQREERGDVNPERVLAMAQRTADDHMHEADAESHALLAEARERSQRVTSEARQMVSDIEQNARRHESEAAADLVTRRAALLKQIEELTEFAENYRVALEIHLAQQGRLLEDRAAL